MQPYVYKSTHLWTPCLFERVLILVMINIMIRIMMQGRTSYIFLAAAVVAVGFGGWYYWYTRGTSSPPTPLLETAIPAGQQQTGGETPQKNMADTIHVTLKTNYGDVTLELFPKDAPVTVENFVKLSREGFYNGTRFHRVIKDFMIQGGDPNSKDDDWSNDGTGGPGYTFKDEINQHKIVQGVIAMANAGPATNGSQFFIVTADATPWLDGKHTVFGRVTAGMDVVEKIETVQTDKARGDHPIENVAINTVEITEK